MNIQLKQGRGMRRNFITAGLLCLTLSIATACRRGNEYGVLVAKFDDEAQLFKAKIFLPTAKDKYQFNFELRQGHVVCSLTGQLTEKEFPDSDSCEGIKGDGKITCNNGRTQRMRWLLTSCLSGYGQSVGNMGLNFFFGFDHNKDRALDQLAKVQRAN